MKPFYGKALVAFVTTANMLLAPCLRADDAKPTEAQPPAAAPAPAPAKPSAKPGQEPADVAAPKHGPDGNILPRFQAQHEAFLRRGKEGKIGLLFLGDSITAGWAKAREACPLRTANP